MESFLGGWAYEKLLDGDDGLVNGDEKRKFLDFLLKYGPGNGFKSFSSSEMLFER